MKRIALSLFAVVIAAGVVIGRAQVTRIDAKTAMQSAKDNDDWLNRWAHRYGESAVRALAEELRRLPWRSRRD